MKRITGMLCLLFCVMELFSQEEQLLEMKAEARVDYQREYVDGKMMKSNSGFEGKYLYLHLAGKLNKNFSYSFCQRLNRESEESFWDATDHLYLIYTRGNWNLSVGNLVLAVGNYEFDRATIDVYFGSEFLNCMPSPCWGVSLARTWGEEENSLLLQVCESPFRLEDEDMYAYSLMWCGTVGRFDMLYSLNLFEYQPGKFINYISLGNRMNLGKATLELDVMNRAVPNQTFFFRNVSIMGDLSCALSESVNVFAKATYDLNKSNRPGDNCVAPGTELTLVGGGVEYFPLKSNRSIRLHATYSQSFGDNANEDGCLLPKQALINVGVTWKVDLFSWKK